MSFIRIAGNSNQMNARSFAKTLATIFPKIKTKWRPRLYWAFVLFIAALAFLMVVTVGNPVKLVMLVALLSFCFAPLYYWLNYYCVTRFIKAEKFRLKRPGRVVALMGIVVMFPATLVCIAFRFGILR